MIIIPNPACLILPILIISNALFSIPRLDMGIISLYIVYLFVSVWHYSPKKKIVSPVFYVLYLCLWFLVFIVTHAVCLSEGSNTYATLLEPYMTNPVFISTMAVLAIISICLFSHIEIPKDMKTERQSDDARFLEGFLEFTNIFVLIASNTLIVFIFNADYRHDFFNLIIFVLGASIYLISRIFNEDRDEKFLKINYLLIIFFNIAFIFFFGILGLGDIYYKHINSVRVLEIITGMNWALPTACFIFKTFPKMPSEEERKFKYANNAIIILASIVMWYAVACFIFGALGGSLLPWNFHWPQIMITK